jgi:UDP-N-acetylmuramate--alanine ligase
MLSLKSISTVYFIGIGGIGMSALARYLQKQTNLKVAGYDRISSPVTRALIKEGIDVNHDRENVPDFMASLSPESCLVVRTPAVPLDHPHHIVLAEKGVRIMKRSELLGAIVNETPTLAVAGTHGKTTTTAILAHLLDGCPGKCNAFLGGISTGVHSNLYVHPNAAWSIVEADEFDRSFLHLHPKFAVITSLDPDHLDIYGDETSFQKAFHSFAQQVEHGCLVHEAVVWTHTPAERYGVTNSRTEAEGWAYAALNPKIIDGIWTADVKLRDQWIPAVQFPMPGLHNLANALAALALAQKSGAPIATCQERLSTFKGIYRRFSYQIRENAGVFIDDYAHHPAELRSAIQTARKQHPGKSITGIFQPHLFSRTQDHLHDFALALDTLDHIILLPIYAAREAPIPGIDSQSLFEKIPNPTKHLIDSERIFECLKDYPPEVLMTLGAGDIDRCVAPIKQWLLEDLNRFKKR